LIKANSFLIFLDELQASEAVNKPLSAYPDNSSYQPLQIDHDRYSADHLLEDIISFDQPFHGDQV